VQALVRAHDGTVTVDSSPEGGSTFRVELPLALE
jgi:two-component system OmpR family sensor kinase